MQYRKLGRTDIDVSVICQGCWSLVSKDSAATWEPNDLEDSIAAIRTSLEDGVNFFDTAEAYGDGESEQILAKALGPRRKGVVLATKIIPDKLTDRQSVRKACEESLGRLKTDYIDLYQIHWPSPTVPLAETIGQMEELRSEGKIRAIGVSNFGLSYMSELLAAGRAETNQLCYNLLMRPVEYEIQPICLENDISILCYSPICQGLLTGKFVTPDDVPPGRARTRLFSKDRPRVRHGEPGCETQVFQALDEIRKICESINQPMADVALAWLLAQPTVTSVIVGGRNAQQAKQNAAAAELELPADAISSLSAATEKIKEYLGANCDPWQSDSRLERPD